VASSNLIDIQNLSIEFKTDEGKIKAVDDISFQVQKGQILGIAGESGSGKSVTAMAILKLIQAPGKISSGSIFFKQEDSPVDLLTLSNKEIRKYRGNQVSMIFQEPMSSLNPVYKCGKQVAEVISIHQKTSKKQARSTCISLFRELMLPRPERIFDQYPHELSGGQKQRVMIAMAMACKPALLIADEPTTALDVTVQKSILQTLLTLRAKLGMSIIFITHDLGVIAEIADEVLIMYRGKIVEKGKVKEVFKNPQHPYTKGLLACRPKPDTRFKRLPTVADFLSGNETEALLWKRKLQEKLDYSKCSDLVSTQNLSTYFPLKAGIFGKKEYVKAVDQINLDVRQGETLGLVGESGCGKTTLGRTILRLIEPSAGEIIYNGINITKLNKSELRKLRKKIQIIFQDPYSSLNPRISIGSAIQEPMSVFKLHRDKKARKEKTLELLEKVGLRREYFNRYPHEFSGGQRQRVCIARALAVEPEFIICDESVSALDVSIQAQILNLLNDLKAEFGFSYIFISHDLAVVKYMSDRVAVMKEGKILELDQADQIYASPKTEYTQNLIDAIPKA
jgi:peptide/nickel transport system ATP-binding protein